MGVQIWTGGEYQHPLGNRLRRRKAALHVDPELATRDARIAALEARLGNVS